MRPQQLHATCVELNGAGILLRGPSGGGKSDLALRLLDAGSLLVADDRVDVKAVDGALFAGPPETLSGLIEARGLGILEMSYRAETRIAVIIDMVPEADIARLPEAETAIVCEIHVPLFRIDPFTVSAVSKVRLAAELALGRIMRRDD